MIPEQEFNEARRRRMVISLGQAQRKGSPSRTRSWQKVPAALCVIVVAIVALAIAGAYLWWAHFKTTPAYSLALLVDAAQRGDMASVDQQVDSDKIVNELAARVTEKAISRYGSVLSSSVRSRVEALVKSLLPGVKQNLRDTFAKRLQEISHESERNPFVVMAITLPYFVNITTESDTAKIVANPRDRLVELTMERYGERWKVSAIKDDLIVQRIVDELIRDLPAIGQLK
jgi:hypothetical protein